MFARKIVGSSLKNRRTSNDVVRSKKLRLEQLEERSLLSAVGWNVPSDVANVQPIVKPTILYQATFGNLLTDKVIGVSTANEQISIDELESSSVQTLGSSSLSDCEETSLASESEADRIDVTPTAPRRVVFLSPEEIEALGVPYGPYPATDGEDGMCYVCRSTGADGNQRDGGASGGSGGSGGNDEPTGFDLTVDGQNPSYIIEAQSYGANSGSGGGNSGGGQSGGRDGQDLLNKYWAFTTPELGYGYEGYLEFALNGQTDAILATFNEDFYVTSCLPGTSRGDQEDAPFDSRAYDPTERVDHDSDEAEIVTRNGQGNIELQVSGGTNYYIIPRNDAVPEEDEVVSFRFVARPTSGGTNLPIPQPGAFNCFTIVDDDHWIIEVSTNDLVVEERLPGVEQSYAYFTFEKVHEKTFTDSLGHTEDVPGDDSYDITVNFEFMYDNSESSFYSAVLWTSTAPVPTVSTGAFDYSLSTSSLGTEDAHTYLENFQYIRLNMEDSNSSEYSCLYQGVIEQGKDSASLRLQPIFDWKDEGALFVPQIDLPSCTPYAQIGELAKITVTNANWAGKPTSYIPVNEANTETIEIKDGAIFELYADYNGDGSLDVVDSIDDKNLMLLVNDDDDNELNGPDCSENGLVANEDDLRHVVLYGWINDPGNYQFDASHTVPSGTGSSVKLWQYSNKRTPCLPDVNSQTQSRSIGTINSSSHVVFSEFWAEGLSIGRSCVDANLKANNGQTELDYNDSVFVVPMSLNLRVDSDNNGYINHRPSEAQREDDKEATEYSKPITYIPVGDLNIPDSNSNTLIIPSYDLDPSCIPETPYDDQDDDPEDEEEDEDTTDLNEYVYVPMELHFEISDTSIPVVCNFTCDNGLALYELDSQNRYQPLSSLHLSLNVSSGSFAKTYYVRAVSNVAGVKHITAKIYADGFQITDVVSFIVQDNGTQLTQWYVPSGWTISSDGTLTTPMPAEDAIPPKDEGTGISVNKGDVVTRDNSYSDNFEVSLHYSFVKNGDNGYLLPDLNKDEISGNESRKKLSFVGNSGVKLGGVKDVPEVAIIDMEAIMTHLGKGQETASITAEETGLETFINGIFLEGSEPRVRVDGYETEPLSCLVPGLIYGGVISGGSLENANSPRAVDYQNWFRDFYNSYKGEQKMKISVSNSNLKVYFSVGEEPVTRNDGNEDSPSEDNWFEIYSQENIVINGDGKIYLQTHWGSGVNLSEIQIATSIPSTPDSPREEL